jgi:hypothetical protein
MYYIHVSKCKNDKRRKEKIKHIIQKNKKEGS